MKTKIYTIVAIGVVVLTTIITCLVIIFIGAKNGGFNYVKLEYNPQIEFVTDKKFKVVSFRPLNDSARLAVAGLQIEGKNIDDVINNVLTESLKLGQFELDINKHNVLKITTVSGLTQALDVHVYKTVNNFIVKNQVPTVIIENANDMEKIKEAKKLNTSVHELALIDSIVQTNNINKNSISNKMPDELIDIVMSINKHYVKTHPTTKDELKLKNEKINNFKETLNLHKLKITKKTTRSFVSNQVTLHKNTQTKYELNYSSFHNLSKTN